VACAVGPSVNPLQNRETQDVNTILHVCINFFEQTNRRHGLVDLISTNKTNKQTTFLHKQISNRQRGLRYGDSEPAPTSAPSRMDDM
jgi:hypothetical protein